ncbi:hypothetical protein H8356DRAFT_1643547 [Neocallimastix lanati (nom. inval.)]|jgi:hypothetical protein|nr:hypothetical protein H8356DRAFT_1643547 [Neocallimastix sp. JGI-2020a]
MKSGYFISILAVLLFATVKAETTQDENKLVLIPGPVKCEYSENDLIVDDDLEQSTLINCNKTNCTSEDASVSILDNSVTITTNGTYVISGSLDGQLRIEAAKNDFVHLILKGITIKSKNGPSINGVSAEKVTITLEEDNLLEDSENYATDESETTTDACLFINSDLTINGSGSLTVVGNFNDAIRCTKDLKLISGSVTIPSAVRKGINAESSICLKDGNYNINSIDSALSVNQDNDAEKGFIVIDNGKIIINTKDDAIHAETHLTINDGYIDVQTSNEGLEAQMIDILGGEMHIYADDDGINSTEIKPIVNSDKIVTMGSKFNMTEVREMLSGLEGMTTEYLDEFMNYMPNIKINGRSSGDSILSYIKALNGTDIDVILRYVKKISEQDGVSHGIDDDSVYINISGGKVYVTVKGVDIDGIDSNGYLIFGKDAEVYVNIDNGFIFDGMGTVDTEGRKMIEEGTTFFATVYSSFFSIDESKSSKAALDAFINMNNNERSFNFNYVFQPSTKNNIMQPSLKAFILTQQAGTELTVKDSNDEVIFSFTPDCIYNAILLTSPLIKAGDEYTISAGTFEHKFTAFEKTKVKE